MRFREGWVHAESISKVRDNQGLVVTAEQVGSKITSEWPTTSELTLLLFAF
jgi:hypothetical protein